MFLKTKKMRKTRFASYFAIFVILSFLHSCSPWHVIEDHSLQESESLPEIRIQLVSGKLIETNHYYLQSDTIIIKARESVFTTGQEQRIPPEQIKTIKAKKTDSIRSIAFFAGIGSALAIWVAILSNNVPVAAPGN